MGTLTALGMYAHFKMFEGYEDTAEEEIKSVEKTKRDRTSAKDLVRGLFMNKPLLILMFADFGKWCFNFVVASSAVYYFKYVANNMPAQAWYILIIAFCSVIGAFISRAIGRALGAKMTLVSCFTIMAICLFTARFMYTQMWPVIILISIAQLGYGICYSISAAMYADTAVYNEWKTGKNASGWIMGIMNLPLKIGSMMRPVIIGTVLAIGGFDANVKVVPEHMKKAIADCLMTIPGLILIAAALILLVGYNLTKDRVDKMQEEIDNR
jgi:GPH family glycoside/pentoside/hexuronide:cation symporter